MRARDAMIPTPLVVLPGCTLLELIQSVLNSNQTTAVVVEAGKLLGIVSVEDILRGILPHYVDLDERLAHAIHEGYFEEKFEKFKHTTVQEVMSTEVDCAAPDDPIIMIVAKFVRHKRKTVPILENGRYVGSVTRRSVLWTVTNHTKN